MHERAPKIELQRAKKLHENPRDTKSLVNAATSPKDADKFSSFL